MPKVAATKRRGKSNEAPAEVYIDARAGPWHQTGASASDDAALSHPSKNTRDTNVGTDTLLWQSCGTTSQMQCTQPHSRHMPSGYGWRCGAADGLGAKSYASGSSGSSSLLDGGGPSHTVLGGSQGRALGPTFGVRGAANVLLARFSSRAASSSFGVPWCLERTYVRTHVRTYAPGAGGLVDGNAQSPTGEARHEHTDSFR